MSILKQGMSGAPVKRLQEKLGIGADGIFGGGTKKAVMDYQKANGLAADGIAGPDTFTAMGLQELVLLRVGSRGAAVKKLQKRWVSVLMAFSARALLSRSRTTRRPTICQQMAWPVPRLWPAWNPSATSHLKPSHAQKFSRMKSISTVKTCPKSKAATRSRDLLQNQRQTNHSGARSPAGLAKPF